MPRGPNERKFEGDIPIVLWEQYESWAVGRGKISNRQLASALFRLFLSAPEWMQLLALFGKEDQLKVDEAIYREFLRSQSPGKGGKAESPDPKKNLLANLRKIAQDVQGNRLRLLSPEEQKEVDDLRRLLGPKEQAEPGKRRKGKEA